MSKFALRRLNMVESQVRPNKLTDARIASAMLDLPREAFLPAGLHGTAYADKDIDIRGIDADGAIGGRFELAPATMSALVQELELSEADVVLAIGGGSGYGAALVASMVQTAVCLEENEVLARWVTDVLEQRGLSNAVVVGGPLNVGWAEEAPYDAILVNGAVDHLPAIILDQLKDGGRLACVQRNGDVGRLVQWRRLSEQFASRDCGDISAPLLPGFAKAPEFVF